MRPSPPGSARRGLVADQHARPAEQGARDADELALAAAEGAAARAEGRGEAEGGAPARDAEGGEGVLELGVGARAVRVEVLPQRAAEELRLLRAMRRGGVRRGGGAMGRAMRGGEMMAHSGAARDESCC